MSAGRVLLLIAVVLFGFAAFPGVAVDLNLMALGSAFFACSFLVS